MITLGSLPLDGTVPRVAVSFSDAATQADINQAKVAGLDIAEIRIDRFGSTDTKHVVERVKLFSQFPTIATIRANEEGGEWKGTETERQSLLAAVIPHVDGVDIELSAIETLAKIGPLAKELDKLLIASFHNFETTPELVVLRNIVSEAESAGADIVKIATQITGDGSQDIRGLTELLVTHPRKNLIVIGMGNMGAITRVLFPRLGSLVTFAFGEEVPSAPGQLPYKVMADLLRQLYPSYGRE
jgi:3-dehydroquinate dehydratase-1